ncbi:MAG: pyruvate kinase [Clostridiales bacterium]|jgi:pyruvate kinase|nr:pyruvate kinase [Clostridiales bacterium]
MRKTKILATLGPATNDIELIKNLMRAGMNAARFNFSHGTHETHLDMINKLKEAREILGMPIPIVLDTKGPEIRIKTFAEDKIYLAQGESFTLTTQDIVGDKTRVAVTYEELPRDLKVGSRVLIDDGLIELKVNSIQDTEIDCVVVNSGFLSSRKGVNVPDVYVNLPSLTERDIVDIKFGVEQGVDFIAASFIRNANDVLKVREVLEENGGEGIQIIAKIESRDGVNNLDNILEVADGIMVARGDLGVEIPPEEVPLVQKQLIHKANSLGKLVVTATQMLESMVQNPRPTRAEANDVANAIFDGSDVIMLSGETASGVYPVEAVAMMARIANKAEESIDYFNEISTHRGVFKSNITNAISYATCTSAADLNAAAIVCVTDSGFTARMVSRFRPMCTILAVTNDKRVYRQLNLTWGCMPEVADNISGNDEVFDIAEQKALESGLAKNGDPIIAVAGVPVGVAGTTNTLKVRIVGDVLIKGRAFGDKTVSGSSRVIKVIEEAERFFKRGDILVTTKTTDEMMPYLRKAGAIVVGSWENIDNSHAETVAKALDIPLLVAKQKVVDLIPDGIAITVDSKNGFVYNGYKFV